jgi:hypothetical protein
MKTAIWATWWLLVMVWWLFVAGWHLGLMVFWLMVALAEVILLTLRLAADRCDGFAVSVAPKPLATASPMRTVRLRLSRVALSRSPGDERRRKATSQGQTRGTYTEPPESQERRPPRPYDAG